MQDAATKTLPVAEPETDRLPLSENPPKKKKVLNPRHKKFIEARASGMTGTDAYALVYEIEPDRRAYARTAAARLMHSNDRGSEEVNRRMEQSVAEAQETFALAISEAASTMLSIING